MRCRARSSSDTHCFVTCVIFDFKPKGGEFDEYKENEAECSCGRCGIGRRDRFHDFIASLVSCGWLFCLWWPRICRWSNRRCCDCKANLLSAAVRLPGAGLPGLSTVCDLSAGRPRPLLLSLSATI